MRLANLEAEMARKSITVEQMALVVRRNPRTIGRWLRCQAPVPISVAFEMQRQLFPSCSLEYLFRECE